MLKREIFADALAIEDSLARRHFLETACAGNPALLAEIEELLAWHASSRSFLDGGMVGPHAAGSIADDPADVPTTSADRAAEIAPPLIPGIRLGGLLGEGGSGRVYEGWQHAPRRRVAVKMLRTALEGHVATQRFHREADILARLDHPGIARVISVQAVRWAGTTVPAIVMELVEGGRPLTRWSAAGRIPLSARLRVFHAVCEAVGHAHRLGVVHRDLKPGNILVDRDGRPKVIDFDWARSQDAESGIDSVRTRTGQLVGTHLYMSPEQFRGGSRIDARSDVWALGVVLFELLVGRPPFPLSGKTIYDAASIVCGSAAPSVTRFDGRLPRDLAVIVATCLDQRPDRRYADAGALAADLGRHLAGEPILACPAGFLDGVRQLARRHRAAAVASVTVAATLLAGTAGIALFARRAEEARREAVAARDAESAALAAAGAARDRASSIAREALWGAYVANLNRLSVQPGTTQPEATRRLLGETARVAGELGIAPEGGGLPLEMGVLEPLLDAAVARLDGVPAIGALAWSPDGARVAAGCRDGGVIHWDPGARDQPRRIAVGDATLSSPLLSADGRWLLGVSADGMARMWSAADGTPIARFGPHGERVTGMALDPAGETAATVCDDGHLRIWNVPAGDSRSRTWISRGRITAVRFRPGDGGAVACGDLEGGSVLCDAASGAIIARFGGRRTRRAAVAFTPDGRLLAVPAYGGGVSIADGATGAVLHELAGPDAAVTDLVFSPEGTRLAVVCGDEPIGVWDPSTGIRTASINGHTSMVIRTAFSPDGRTIATACADRMVRLHDAADGRAIASLRGHDDRVDHLSWSPGGDRLATAGGGTIRIWDVRGDGGPAVMRGDGTRMRSVRFTPDGTALVAATTRGGIEVWDVATASRRRTLPSAAGKGAPFALAPAPGGALAAFPDADGGVRVETTEGSLRLSLPPARKPPRALAFDPDADHLFVAREDGSMRIHGVNGGAVIAETSLPAGGLRHAVLSPDGAWVAAAGDGSGISVWHPASDRTTTIPVPPGAVRDLVFRPGHPGQFVVASATGRLLLLDAADGGLLGECTVGFDPTAHVTFSPDGRRLAVAGRSGQLCLVSIADDRTVLPTVGHDLRINALAWNPDGTRMVTGSADHTVRLWDAATGAVLVVLEGHTGPVVDVAVSPDGRLVASAGADGTVRLWGRSNGAIDAARRGTDR